MWPAPALTLTSADVARNPDELTFDRGAELIITSTDQADPGWWRGRLATGEVREMALDRALALISLPALARRGSSRRISFKNCKSLAQKVYPFSVSKSKSVSCLNLKQQHG